MFGLAQLPPIEFGGAERLFGCGVGDTVGLLDILNSGRLANSHGGRRG